MAELIAKIKTKVVWGNSKGEFFHFEERPETFWRWGLTKYKNGDEIKIQYVPQAMGSITDALRIIDIMLPNENQARLTGEGRTELSGIEQAAQSTGAKVLGSAAGQAATAEDEGHKMEYKDLRDVLKTLQKDVTILRENYATTEARMDALAKKLQILQNKVGVSFV